MHYKRGENDFYVFNDQKGGTFIKGDISQTLIKKLKEFNINLINI
jgi:hypothetical protein